MTNERRELQASWRKVAHPCVQSQGVDSLRVHRGRSTCGIDFDASQAPYYAIRFAPAVTDAEVEGVLTRMREVWKERRKIVVLCDVSDSALTPRQRKLVTDEMKREHANYLHWVDGWALVVRSAVAKNTLTALTWVQPPPFEMRVFDTLENARAWASQRMSESHQRR
jgi:SpoIIAA-like